MRPALFAALLLLLTASPFGCATAPRSPSSPPPPPPERLNSIVLSGDIGKGAKRWESEARKRLRDPLILVCHGTTRNDSWYLQPDIGPPLHVEGVARLLKKAFPGRPILLIVCNEGAHQLYVPGVYYAKSIVWSIPRTGKDRGVERIEEFYEGRLPE
jgi:hypothetical protein